MDLETRLDRLEKNVKSHIDQRLMDKLGPMQDRLDGHQRTLYGANGNNGLTRDVNRLKWLSGIVTGGILTAVYWLKDKLLS